MTGVKGTINLSYNVDAADPLEDDLQLEIRQRAAIALPMSSLHLTGADIRGTTKRAMWVNCFTTGRSPHRKIRHEGH
jgi:hypothetical protein